MTTRNKNVLRKIPNDVIEALKDAAKALGNDTSWIKVKKFVLLIIKPESRKLFSTRDRKTYLQEPNELEKLIMEKYTEITGMTLTGLDGDEKDR